MLGSARIGKNLQGSESAKSARVYKDIHESTRICKNLQESTRMSQESMRI